MEEFDYIGYCKALIGGLCQYPEEIEIDKKVDEMGVLLTVRLNKDDMGAVIGRKGQTAQAIRWIVKSVGAKNKAHMAIKIEEPAGSERPRRDW